MRDFCGVPYLLRSTRTVRTPGRVEFEIAGQAAAPREEPVVRLPCERRRLVANVRDQQRLDDLAISRIAHEIQPGPVSAQEIHQHRFVTSRPAPPDDAGCSLIRPQCLCGGEHVKAARFRQQLERRAQQRCIVFTGDEIAVSVGGAARAHVFDVAVGDAVARKDLPQHKGCAGGHGVDRQRLPFEICETLDFRGGREGEESAVDAHECYEVGRVRRHRFALAFLIGDEIVDEREAQVVAPFEQRSDKEGRIRRVAQLHGKAMGLEVALSLRRPQRHVPPAVEGNDGQACRRSSGHLRDGVSGRSCNCSPAAPDTSATAGSSPTAGSACLELRAAVRTRRILHSITLSARSRIDSGNLDAERLGGSHVYGQLELGWLFDGEIPGLRTPEDLVDVGRCAAKLVRGIRLHRR